MDKKMKDIFGNEEAIKMCGIAKFIEFAKNGLTREDLDALASEALAILRKEREERVKEEIKEDTKEVTKEEQQVLSFHYLKGLIERDYKSGLLSFDGFLRDEETIKRCHKQEYHVLESVIDDFLSNPCLNMYISRFKHFVALCIKEIKYKGENSDKAKQWLHLMKIAKGVGIVDKFDVFKEVGSFKEFFEAEEEIEEDIDANEDALTITEDEIIHVLRTMGFSEDDYTESLRDYLEFLTDKEFGEKDPYLLPYVIVSIFRIILIHIKEDDIDINIDGENNYIILLTELLNNLESFDEM